MLFYIVYASQDGLWQQLWGQAVPCPAAQQRPLLDAEREGELALDWLDTLPPSLVWQQLSAIALGGAIALLARCDGALLPPAAERMHG